MRAVLLDTCALIWLGFNSDELTPRPAFRSVELPDIHNDPADRFIIATALENDLPVVTSDDKF